MENAEGRNNRGVAMPVFLAGVGAGIVLTLLLRSGGAFRTLIDGKVKVGADWVEGKAVAAKDEVLTHATGLREAVKAAAGTITRS